MNDAQVKPIDSQGDPDSGEARELESHEIPRAIQISESLRKFVDAVGRFG